MSRPAAASKALKMEVAVPVCLDATKCIAVCCLGYIQITITKGLSSSFLENLEKKKKRRRKKKQIILLRSRKDRRSVSTRVA